MPKRIIITRLSCALILIMAVSSFALAQNQLSPTETVRLFYQKLREKKFKEAFAMSIYKPAVEPLSAKEVEDLRVEFERVAAAIPEKLELSGETISGDLATVFVKETDETGEKLKPTPLIKSGGVWIVGDRENEAIVKKAGKSFFFNARINVHHDEVQDMLTRISLAQVIHSQGNNGLFANLAELITKGLVPKDLEATHSTGYVFKVIKSADGKAWYATAEPAEYGRTGKLSFHLDATGVRSGDVGGKPLMVKN